MLLEVSKKLDGIVRCLIDMQEKNSMLIALDMFTLYKELDVSNFSNSQVFGGGEWVWFGFFSSFCGMEYLGFVTQDIQIWIWRVAHQF